MTDCEQAGILKRLFAGFGFESGDAELLISLLGDSERMEALIDWVFHNKQAVLEEIFAKVTAIAKSSGRRDIPDCINYLNCVRRGGRARIGG